MIKKFDELNRVVNENMRGGVGSVTLTHLAGAGEMYGKSRLYARATLKPGCSIGFHVHENETELYHVVSGSALYDDNGVEVVLSAGDTTVTPSGQGHSIANNGDDDLEIVALIVLE